MPDRSDGRAGISAGLVRALVAEQFPRWAGLRVTPVEIDGWDNRAVFRETVLQSEDVWARARGWALWKSLISLAGDNGGPTAARNQHIIEQVLAEASGNHS